MSVICISSSCKHTAHIEHILPFLTEVIEMDNGLYLGIEFGSTRIKAVLINGQSEVVAQGYFEWADKIVNKYWSYDMTDVRRGIQKCYLDLKRDYRERYNSSIDQIRSIGVSAMMHGYLVFDEEWNQLCEYRTWRNTLTGYAASELSSLFSFNIPQRWSVAHLYNAILNKEDHVCKIAHLTTLAGYVHYLLTGENCVGIGEASGIFPIDSGNLDYDRSMISKFDNKVAEMGIEIRIEDLMPLVKVAGENAGCLSEAGALLLDPDGDLKSGIPVCPPEGDAGTGMTATNSIKPNTGNVSGGTSIFSMVVLEKELGRSYEEIDMVTTPDGKPVAMVHCNTCTSDINEWINLFGEVAEVLGKEIDKGALFELMFRKALSSEAVSGLLSFNCYAGEPAAGIENGIPMLVRDPETPLSLDRLMKSLLFTSVASLKIGMERLQLDEGISISNINAHGGLFKTEKVGQQILANALNVPVSVMKTAGEGGPWGMAILAAYMVNRKENETLVEYLDNRVFAESSVSTVMPEKEGVEEYSNYIDRFKALRDLESEVAKRF